MRATLNYCKSCRAQIIWARTLSGGKMPVDFYTVPEGDRMRVPLPYDPAAGHVSHFETCPDAEKHRKQPRKGAA